MDELKDELKDDLFDDKSRSAVLDPQPCKAAYSKPEKK